MLLLKSAPNKVFRSLVIFLYYLPRRLLAWEMDVWSIEIYQYPRVVERSIGGLFFPSFLLMCRSSVFEKKICAGFPHLHCIIGKKTTE